MRQKQQAGFALEVKRLTSEVVGTDEPARRTAAVALAMSRDGASHVILWGDVRKDEGQLYVEPRLTVARPLGKELPEDRSLGSFTSEGPSHISFKRRLSTEVADTIAFTLGLARFNAGSWEEAATIFAQANSPSNRLYHATTLIAQYIEHFRKTGDTKGRLATLHAAEAELLTATQALMDTNNLDLAGLSLLKLGDALRLRNEWTEALKRYEEAEAVAAKARNSAHQAAALIGQARTKLYGTRDLEGALKDIERGILLYDQRNDTAGRVNALDWKAIVQEAQGDLNGALESLDRALSLARGIEDRELVFYVLFNRASVNQKISESYAEKRAFGKAYSAVNVAKGDYEHALAVADALGWKGLAQQTRDFLERLELRRQMIKWQEQH